MSEALVQQAFLDQAVICTAAGAPFTGRLCRLVGERLTAEGEIGRRVLDWTGVPSHQGDALPLRLMGGLHALARSGRDEALSGLYPPATAPGDDEALWSVVTRVLVEQAEFLSPWLDGPPQTNEVGRSAALMAGLLVLADRFGLSFALCELGASAGLNTILDRYAYRLGQTEAGEAGSPVRLEPVWTGASPPSAGVTVARRAGVDRNPLDVRDPATRERLSAYVWADQRARLARLEAALDLAAGDPAVIDKADAADWLEAKLGPPPEPGVCRVVMHTIAYQYFPPDSQARIRAHIEAVGAKATEAAPLGWLSFGLLSPGEGATPDTMQRASPVALAVLGLLVTGLEAAFFTIIPIELARRFLKKAWIGAGIGGIGYVVVMHWDNGWLGLATSGWIWAVVTIAYFLDRPTSVFRASLQAIGLKWVFWAFAFSSLVSAS